MTLQYQYADHLMEQWLFFSKKKVRFHFQTTQSSDANVKCKSRKLLIFNKQCGFVVQKVTALVVLCRSLATASKQVINMLINMELSFVIEFCNMHVNNYNNCDLETDTTAAALLQHNNLISYCSTFPRVRCTSCITVPNCD